jgi:serine protease Do
MFGMTQKTIHTRRWAVLTAVLLAAVVGAMAGSLATARGGHIVPVLMAAKAATQGAGDQVSFADGFAPVVKKAVPAVVNVSTSKIVKTKGNVPPWFQQFFGNQFNVPRERREHALGSGVIFSPDGYIVTNNHVIDGASDVKVMLGNKKEYEAKIIGTDAKTDIAVLKIDATGLPTLPFGDSAHMQQGDFVVAIGNPFGLSQTVTMGIVSATGRGGLGIEDIEDFIQTDAAINPGNSGGALIDTRGNLIGINTAILSGGQGGGNQGIGFAIPIDMARQVMDQILKHGKVIRGWLGVVIQPVTPEIAKSFGLSEPYGALIGDVDPDGPAAKAGVKVGDIILDVNGQRIDTSRDLQLKIAQMDPGTTVKLTVFRNGSKVEIPVALGEMPSKTEKSSGQEGETSGVLQGLSVQDLTPTIAEDLQLPPSTKGVVVTQVSPISPAADAGLQRGDVIQQVNRTPVANVAQYERAVRQAGKTPVLLLVNRGGTTMFVTVQPE